MAVILGKVSGKGMKVGLDFLQGFAEEVFSHFVLGRSAPQTGPPTVGGGLGGVAAKFLISSMKTTPAAISSISLPSASGAPGSGGGDGGVDNRYLIGGLIVAGVLLAGVGGYYYLRKAQSESAARPDTPFLKELCALVNDPEAMAEFKRLLREKAEKAGMDKGETGRFIAQQLGDIRAKARELGLIAPPVPL